MPIYLSSIIYILSMGEESEYIESVETEFLQRPETYGIAFLFVGTILGLSGILEIIVIGGILFISGTIILVYSWLRDKLDDLMDIIVADDDN